MRIKLKHDKTGKIKTISRLDSYPIKVGEKIRFNKWKNLDDIWTAIAIVGKTEGGRG